MTTSIPLQQIWPAEFAQKYRDAHYWQGETFGALLRDRARQHADRVAVIGQGQRWSYAELDERASALAAGLLKLGLKKGDRVLVHLPNIPEFISVIFALFRTGMIPVYALPAHRIAEIEHFANSAPAAGYIGVDQHAGFDYRVMLRELRTRCPQLQHIVVHGQAEEFTALEQVRASGAGIDIPASDAQPSDVAFLQISGGSTGLSKLIPRTHDDYIYTLRESARICGLDQDSVFLGALPIAHNFPMSSPGFLGALYAGARVVLSPSPAPDACFALIEQEKVTDTSLVPPLLLLWLEAAPNSKADLSSLKVVQVGGAKLAAEVAKRVRPVLGITLQQVFGMAEGLVNYTRLDDPDEIIIHTQGRPISPADEILIVDDNGAPVPQGESGYLLTRGPYTIRAYHNNPAANARSFTEDGFYRTGDIVKMTPEGYLSVQGRANDHINRAGEKISAEEIEDHLLAHPQVFDAAIVAIPDPYLGERSCAFIIPKGEKPRAVQIKQWVRSRGLADFKVPDQVVFVDRFVETAALKISRKELRAQLRQQLEQAAKAE
ncbi:(2,3-dihydroxybenzoyl)adenylate synthase [Pusillimonas sp. SM2304]|uniref:(2,3-dihydroxybenzoyl)adenylate synthase n=1 Tax=Pusillimonas sp. SM2304 TaxID=3073241 RepID=UPI0028745D90|nr:(2,3-dihydroxybenzoyl)adenylate synthase [Pusillimonas sp. SM2304]MDS1138865.1 (2,3-dihydroxybenzoyl)adenylate synthase [Pusillimonas sp. SM2304]